MDPRVAGSFGTPTSRRATAIAVIQPFSDMAKGYGDVDGW
jgi:hypothetical protein